MLTQQITMENVELESGMRWKNDVELSSRFSLNDRLNFHDNFLIDSTKTHKSVLRKQPQWNLAQPSLERGSFKQ